MGKDWRRRLWGAVLMSAGDNEPGELTRPTGFVRRILLDLVQVVAAIWFCFWMLMAVAAFAFRDFAPEPGSQLSVSKALLYSSMMAGIGCFGLLILHVIRRGVNNRDPPLKENPRGFEVLPPR